jgi:hypothetical protein
MNRVFCSLSLLVMAASSLPCAAQVNPYKDPTSGAKSKIQQRTGVEFLTALRVTSRLCTNYVACFLGRAREP